MIRAVGEVRRFLRTQFLLGVRAGLPRRDARIRAVRSFFEGF